MTTDTARYYVPTVGARGPWRSLGAICRHAHELRQRADAEARAAHAEYGTDPDVDTDPAALAADLDAAATALRAGDRAGAQKSVRRVAAALVDDPIGDYTGDPALDAVRVRLRGVSARHYVDAMSRIQAALAAGDMGEVVQVQQDLVARVVVGVRGLEGDQGEIELGPPPEGSGTLSAEDVEILDIAGLVPALFVACRTWQEADPPTRRTCGV